MKVGDKFLTKDNQTIVVVKYNSWDDVVVYNENTGVQFKTRTDSIKSGKVAGNGRKRLKNIKFDSLPEGFSWVSGYEGYICINRQGTVLCNKADGIHEHPKCRIKDKSRGILTYYVVGISLNGFQEHKYIHRLVAETFIPNPENKPQVNHIDGDKTNNCVDNLEWVTASENTRHAHDIGLFDESKDRTLRKFLSGDFDEDIVKSVEAGKLVNISRKNCLLCPESVLARLGIDPALFKALTSIGVKRNVKYSREQLIEMNKTMTMTEIAKITGYSLSAISRRINGSRK